MRNSILLVFVILLSGCSLEREVKVPVYRELKVPKSLLTTYSAPKVPVILNEREISKYTLELYTRFEKNRSKKIQIQRIIKEFNKK